MTLVLVLVIITCNLFWATGNSTEGIKIFMDYWQNGNNKCTSIPAEEFKLCVAEKRRNISAVSQFFKSISCQCHVIPNEGGDLSLTRGYHVFRQCFLTGERIRGEYNFIFKSAFLSTLYQLSSAPDVDITYLSSQIKFKFATLGSNLLF